ncbi:MAG: SpoIID/LytB domain-containing protein [Elusimicrobiaceae bacterium]|nr:SpoIID/LytB domain-containing protein [Elusimicrobiaceae bacterium]
MNRKIFLSIFFCLCAGGPLCAGMPSEKGIIRINLAENLTFADIGITGKTLVADLNTGKKFKIPAPTTFGVRPLGADNIRIASYTFSSALRLTPYVRTDRLTYSGKSYRGSIVARADGKGSFTLIEELGLEEYLYGVLPIEMSPAWPIEALKAQAVAARTYALYNMTPDSKNGFDLYSDVRDQAYVGASRDCDSVLEAVRATEGEVLTYDGNLIPAFYHANCGGKTSPPAWGKGESDPIPPLRGVSCGYCGFSKNYEWDVSLSARKLLTFLASYGHKAERIKRITVSDRNDAGRVSAFEFKTDEDDYTVKTSDLRKYFGASFLRSSYIKKVYAHGGDFIFEGRGYGHGVGMCQDGAKGLAERGYKYTLILRRYYPSARLMDWRDVK